MDAIKGTYTGDCKEGKANGKGKSAGTDEYEGEFINGYPDGKGMYIWKDGHYYDGSFKKGKKEGEGNMYYESVSGDDSIITGFWKKDKYFGQYEKQFIVISSTNQINRVQCSLVDKKGSDIIFKVHQLNYAVSNPTSLGTLPFVSDITKVTGDFYSRNTQTLTNYTLNRLQQVTFPFRAIFYFSNGQNTEIQFNEKGEYNIDVELMY